MAVKTGSVERLVGSYHAWATNGASRAPAWLKDLRAGGIARFSELGFPNMKQEAWRFTSVAPIADATFALAHPPARLPSLVEIQPFLLGDTGHRLVFVNGFYQRALSTAVADTLRVQSLADALAEDPDAVRAHL
ncbi:MAG: hypothetical protein DMD48_04415, partial [Gemmatimonadetes bacterium]